VAAAVIAFLATALMGVKVHLWSKSVVYANKHSFSVRAYGLCAILLWSFVAAILTEVAWRFWSAWAMRHTRKGYAIANRTDHESQGPLDVANGDDDEVEISNHSVGFNESTKGGALKESTRRFELASLTPGMIYSEEIVYGKTTRPVVELSISNGRPTLQHGGGLDDADEKSGEKKATSFSEATLQQVVGANQPGVFYCGPDALLESIKVAVNGGRDERRRLCGEVVADCTFYEESFEM